MISLSRVFLAIRLSLSLGQIFDDLTSRFPKPFPTRAEHLVGPLAHRFSELLNIFLGFVAEGELGADLGDRLFGLVDGHSDRLADGVADRGADVAAEGGSDGAADLAGGRGPIGGFLLFLGTRSIGLGSNLHVGVRGHGEDDFSSVFAGGDLGVGLGGVLEVVHLLNDGSQLENA